MTVWTLPAGKGGSVEHIVGPFYGPLKEISPAGTSGLITNTVGTSVTPIALLCRMGPSAAGDVLKICCVATFANRNSCRKQSHLMETTCLSCSLGHVQGNTDDRPARNPRAFDETNAVRLYDETKRILTHKVCLMLQFACRVLFGANQNISSIDPAVIHLFALCRSRTSIRRPSSCENSVLRGGISS